MRLMILIGVLFLAACSAPGSEPAEWFIEPAPTLDRFIVNGALGSGGPPPMELELVCGGSNESTSWSFVYPDGRSGGATTRDSTTTVDIDRGGEFVARCTGSDGSEYEGRYTVEADGFTAVDFAAYQPYDQNLSVHATCEPYGGVGKPTIEIGFEGEMEQMRLFNWDSKRFDAPGVYEVTCRVTDEANNVFEQTIEVEVVERIVFDPEAVELTIVPNERGGFCVVDGPVPDVFSAWIIHDGSYSGSTRMPVHSTAYFFERPGPGPYDIECGASYGDVSITAEATIE